MRISCLSSIIIIDKMNMFDNLSAFALQKRVNGGKFFDFFVRNGPSSWC